jgi:phenylpyruvate tautomerase PptA (4-oxalocrotonate tautomerase family)
MPLLKLETSVALPEKEQTAILAALSKLLARATGKPEQYVMVTHGCSAILMSAQPGPAAWVEIRSIGGLTADVNRKLSQQICQLLQDSAGIPPARVYLNFTDLEAVNWGWNGSTFG